MLKILQHCNNLISSSIQYLRLSQPHYQVFFYYPEQSRFIEVIEFASGLIQVLRLASPDTKE